MRGTRRLLLVLLAFAAPTLQAQIVVTHADMQAALAPGTVFTQFTYHYHDAVPYRVDVGRTRSTAQTWNFNGADRITRMTTDTLVFRVAEARTFGDSRLYPKATLTLSLSPPRQTNLNLLHLFFSLRPDGLVREGWVNRVTPPEQDEEYAAYQVAFDGLQTFMLPVQKGASVTYRDSTFMVEGVGSLASMSENVVREGTLTVDGFGMVTFPDGVVDEALRLVRDQMLTIYRPNQPVEKRRDIAVLYLTRDFRQLLFNLVHSQVEARGVVRVESATYTAPGYLVTAAETEATPVDLTFAAPYPNPARSAVTLRYALDVAREVMLAAYDVLGREVAVLTDEMQPAGPHDLHIDVTGWTPGVYLFRLQSGESQQTRLVTVVR